MRTDIYDCARCGQDHRNIDLHPMDNHDKFTHFATCPVTKQPIMVRMTTDDTPEER